MTHPIAPRNSIAPERERVPEMKPIVHDARRCIEDQRSFLERSLGIDAGEVEFTLPRTIPVDKRLKPLLVPASMLASEALIALQSLGVYVESHIENPDNIICGKSNDQSYIAWTPAEFDPDEQHLGLKPREVISNFIYPQTFLEHILMQVRDIETQKRRMTIDKLPRLHNEKRSTICNSVYQGRCVITALDDRERKIIIRTLRWRNNTPYAPRLMYM